MRSPYSILKVTGPQHVVTLRGLQAMCFPDDPVVDPGEGWWWIVYGPGQAPVGFAAMTLGIPGASGGPAIGYLRRGGIIPGHRGHGLQGKLISVRERLCRALGFTSLVSTTFDNPHSGNNLIRAGFTMFEPGETAWGAEGTVYWRKELT